MNGSFRQSMAWLHTWVGLTFGWLLFVILLTGTFSVFAEPITQWMQAPESAGWHRLLAGGGDMAAGLPRNSEGGRFFVRLHSTFYSDDAGRWLVGLITMAMLVALVSGVIIHNRIFRDFFTFRRGKGQRSWLDAHAAFAVMTLPFLLVIAYSGLMVVYTTYMPAGIAARYDGDGDAYRRALFNGPRNAATPRQAPAAAVPPALSFSNHPPLYRLPGRLHYSTALETQGSLVALHFAQFGGAVVRWLYFLAGLAASTAAAIGLVLYTVKRRKAGAGRFLDLVERLNCSMIAGVPLAIAGYFWVNRLLPAKLGGRYEAELAAIFIVWAASLLHAALRPLALAWREQFTALALLCAGLPVVNALTADVSLLTTLPRGDWEFAGVDLMALVFAVVFAATAWRLRLRRPALVAEIVFSEIEASRANG